MSSEDHITWNFSERQKSAYIKDEVQAGKYIFRKTRDAISEEEYQRRAKEFREKENKHLEKPEYGILSVSWKVPTNEADKIRNETEVEIREILKLITLQTNFTFDLGTSCHVPHDSTKSKTLHGVSVLQPKIQEIEPDILRIAVQNQEKIYSHSSPKKEYLLRAIEWYHRGAREIDRTNSFADYWIGFETLSFWFDGEESSGTTCEKCGQSLHAVSISARMKNFVKTLGCSFTGPDISKLFSIRSGLFHQSKEIDIQNRNDAQKLLKECIELCLKL